MSERADTEQVTSLDRLRSIEKDWWQLWTRSPAATMFQTPAWLIPWWESFAPGRLATVAAWQGGRLVALAPCYLEESSARLLPLGVSVSDQLDVLVDPDCRDAPSALARGLLADGAWREWRVEELGPSSAAPAIADRIDALSSASEPHGACPVLDLAGSGPWPDAVPKRRRDQVRHALSSARRRGEVAISQARDPDAFLDALLRLHAARWAPRGEAGVLADPQVQAFQRRALPGLARAGLARIYLLSIGGALAACHYGFAAKGEASFYIGGFDPAFAHQSPGAILIGHAIAEAKAEGCRAFSFLRGREPYKYGWGAVDRWNSRLVVERA